VPGYQNINIQSFDRLYRPEPIGAVAVGDIGELVKIENFPQVGNPVLWEIYDRIPPGMSPAEE